jgi:hypothetical protein
MNPSQQRSDNQRLTAPQKPERAVERWLRRYLLGEAATRFTEAAIFTFVAFIVATAISCISLLVIFSAFPRSVALARKFRNP